MEQTKILVVDDDREIVGAIAALLELEGYTVPTTDWRHWTRCTPTMCS